MDREKERDKEKGIERKGYRERNIKKRDREKGI